MVFGLRTEGLPATHQMIGFLLAIAAIWLIASAPGELPGKLKARSLWMGSIAGVCFGTYFVLLKLVSHGGVVWAMAMSRIASTSLALLLCILFAIRPKAGAISNRWGCQTLALAAAVGALDTGGNMLYMLATRLGRLDVAAVLSSLYPAVTILLAAWLLKERTTRGQTVGMALAVGAVALIAG
jgi:drug/metabolite transporter (DMT)-like permease